MATPARARLGRHPGAVSRDGDVGGGGGGGRGPPPRPPPPPAAARRAAAVAAAGGGRAHGVMLIGAELRRRDTVL